MKRLVLLISCGLICAAAVWHFWPRTKQTNLPAAQHPVAAAATRTSGFKQIKDQAIPRPELETEKAATGVPKECAAQWDAVARASFEQLIGDLKRGVFHLHSECENVDPEMDVLKGLYKACAYEPRRGFLQDETGCISKIAFYRAFLIDGLSPDQTDYQTMSLQLLANKIFSRFQRALNDPAARAETAKMINALIDRQPDLVDAHKALVAVKMFGLGSPDYSPDEMRAATLRGLALNPNDGQLTEAYLLNEQAAGHPESVGDYLARHPDSGLGYYYRAWDSWNAKDRDAALEDLRQAARLSPGDQRIAKTLADAEQNRDGKIFSVTVGFSLGDL